MSAIITIKIEVNNKREQYTSRITRTFPSDHAELTAAYYYHRLKQELWDGVSHPEAGDRPPEQFGPGYPKSEFNPGGY